MLHTASDLIPKAPSRENIKQLRLLLRVKYIYITFKMLFLMIKIQVAITANQTGAA